MSRLRPVALHLSVLAVAVCAFYLQGPSYLRHPATRLSDRGDALLNAWIMAWDTHALADGTARVWDAPIQYPARNVLTFSETMFGNLWLAYPVLRLTGNLILAANLHILAAFVLTLYATFLLVRHLTGCYLAGLAAGFLFSFNPVRWSQLTHMNLLPFFWAPLALLCCHRFLQTRRVKPLAGMVLALLGQYYTSMNLGTVLLTTLLLFGGAYCLWECRGPDRLFFLRQRRVRWMLLGAAVFGVVCLVPLVLPYMETLHDWDMIRSESENASFSVEPLGFLVPPAMFASYRPWHEFWADRVRSHAGHFGLGLAPWLLGGAGLVVSLRRAGHVAQRLRGEGDDQARVARRFAATALCAAVLMLGPYLVWQKRTLPVPLPYLLVFYGLPGARGMRVPARFFLPLLLCLSVLAGFAVAHVVRSWARWRLAAKALVGVAVVAWLGWDYAVTDSDGIVLPPPAQFPAVYTYVAGGEPDAPVLELPADKDNRWEYQYYQTAHWRPEVGGETGGATPGAVQLIRRLAKGPTDAALRLLALTPTATLVVHLDQYNETEASAWRGAPLERYGFRCAGSMGDAVVWEREEEVRSSARLRVVGVKVEPRRRLWQERLVLSLTVASAEAGLPWRYLDRGMQDVEVTLTDHRGVTKTFTRRLEVPPYLLPEEVEVLTPGPFDGLEGPLRTVRVRGPLLEDYEENLSP
jgi:hypothetical protein